MAYVVVFNSNARTVKIATSPVKYLSEVRDEACGKFGLSGDQFALKYNDKPISLSQQIRLANLPQGARLELVQASRSPTVVSVALQLSASEDNVRLTQKFASTTSLWELLRFFESSDERRFNFTQRGAPVMSGEAGPGRLYYEMPVITVMPDHREQSSFVGLQQTLGQLGFDNGSALLKLTHKTSDTPLEEAMAEISQYFRTEGHNSAGAAGQAAASAQERPISGSDLAVPEAREPSAGRSHDDASRLEVMDMDTIPTAESLLESEAPSQTDGEKTYSAARLESPATCEDPISFPGAERPRNVQIFSASQSPTPQAARNAFHENDYLPTVEHAKIHQASLLSKTRNQRLLSDAELEEQERERRRKTEAAADKGGTLRIRMPDGLLIQMNLDKTDTAAGLYEVVKGLLERPDEPFRLNHTGPTGRLVLVPHDEQRLLQDLKFFNNELVTFQWAETASAEVRASRKALAHEWQAKAQTLRVEEPGMMTSESKEAVAVAEGKKGGGLSVQEKERKLKNLLGKGLFKKKS